MPLDWRWCVVGHPLGAKEVVARPRRQRGSSVLKARERWHLGLVHSSAGPRHRDRVVLLEVDAAALRSLAGGLEEMEASRIVGTRPDAPATTPPPWCLLTHSQKKRASPSSFLSISFSHRRSCRRLSCFVGSRAQRHKLALRRGATALPARRRAAAAAGEAARARKRQQQQE